MRGLALEGGGARGAYHIGAVKALMENGYQFDGFVGTSIGAINAALLAQDDFDVAFDLWANISLDQIFDADEKQLLSLTNLSELKLDMKLPAKITKALKKVADDKGLDTTKMRALIERVVDEGKLRASGKDFGLVTVSLSDRKPLELLLEDIPEGKLIDYIMASASLPGFQSEVIDGKKFIDGGLYNNCPSELLLNKGYDEIIAIRTHGPGFVRKVQDHEKIKEISAREDLGNVVLFSKENSAAKIKLGYYDGLRFIRSLRGFSYYIEPVDAEDFYLQLSSLNDHAVYEVGKLLDLEKIPAKRMLFEKIVPLLGTYLKLEKDFDYTDFVIALLEHKAKQAGVERFAVYDFEQLRLLAENGKTEKKERGVLAKLSGVGPGHKKSRAAETLFGYLA